MQILHWIRHIGFPLAAGGMIYAVHFAWPGLIPKCLVDYLPDLLWAYALMSAIVLIQPTSRARTGRVWVVGALLLGPLLEVLQWTQTMPGSPDLLDVVAYTAGGLLAWYRDRRAGVLRSQHRTSTTGHIISGATLGMFVLFALATSIDDDIGDYVDIRMQFEFGGEQVVMHNLNRFALLEWQVTLDDKRQFTYTASGDNLAPLSSDTLVYDSLFTTHPQYPLTVDSLKRVKVSCRITGTKMGFYSERLD